MQGALKGGRSIEVVHAQTTRRREECVAKVRKTLAEQAPEVLPHFELLFDWALFWGPALNNRAWAGVAGNGLRDLWKAICRALQRAGLVEEIEEIGYFTAEDLAHIAATGDIEQGRQIWQRRRRQYEYCDRLQAPAYLGKVPDETEDLQEVPSKEGSARIVEQTEAGAIIVGKRVVPGQSSGIAHKIEALDEADSAGDEHVLFIARPLQPTAGHTPILFSLMLRLRGLVVPNSPMMWMHHIGQIARECGVPIVLIPPEDMDRIPEGCAVSIDGSEGTVTIQG